MARAACSRPSRGKVPSRPARASSTPRPSRPARLRDRVRGAAQAQGRRCSPRTLRDAGMFARGGARTPPLVKTSRGTSARGRARGRAKRGENRRRPALGLGGRQGRRALAMIADRSALRTRPGTRKRPVLASGVLSRHGGSPSQLEEMGDRPSSVDSQHPAFMPDVSFYRQSFRIPLYPRRKKSCTGRINAKIIPPRSAVRGSVRSPAL